MSQIIVAMSGARPQNEREADGLGFVALVGDTPADEPAETLQGALASRIKRIGEYKGMEWHRWFDKTVVLSDDDADALLPALTARPRLVLLGKGVAASFGLTVQGKLFRWTWVDWSRLRPELELEDPRPQLVAIARCPPAPDDWPRNLTEEHRALVFWQGIAHACRGKRGRTN